MESVSQNSTCSSSDPWAGISFEANDWVFDQEVIAPGEEIPFRDAETEGDPVKRKITVEKVKSWYSSEKMHRHIVKVLGWVGRKKGYQSLQVDPNDEDFRDACNELYELVAHSGFSAAFEVLGDERVESAVIMLIGFGKVAGGVIGEKMEKSEAAQHERQINTEHQKRKDGNNE